MFKKLFSKEEITFEDMCETKSVTGALYLDMNETFPDVTAEELELANRNYNKGPNPMSGGDWKPKRLNPHFEKHTDEDLLNEIAKGHNYIFVGRVGQFCPIKTGCGGGLLCRESVDKKTGEKKYDAATGTKGYRWLESEMVKELDKQDAIDRSYYDAMVDAAAHDISEFGDFEWFVSDDPYIPEDKPPWFGPGEPWKEEKTAFDVR